MANPLSRRPAAWIVAAFAAMAVAITVLLGEAVTLAAPRRRAPPWHGGPARTYANVFPPADGRPEVILQDPFTVEPWNLRETQLDLDLMAETELVFALANGHEGWRANLDEGEPHALPGSYLNGVYVVAARAGHSWTHPLSPSATGSRPPRPTNQPPKHR